MKLGSREKWKIRAKELKDYRKSAKEEANEREWIKGFNTGWNKARKVFAGIKEEDVKCETKGCNNQISEYHHKYCDKCHNFQTKRDKETIKRINKVILKELKK